MLLGMLLGLPLGPGIGCPVDATTVIPELGDRESEALGPKVGCWLGMLLGP